jgi:hypothetical protein
LDTRRPSVAPGLGRRGEPAIGPSPRHRRRPSLRLRRGQLREIAPWEILGSLRSPMRMRGDHVRAIAPRATHDDSVHARNTKSESMATRTQGKRSKIFLCCRPVLSSRSLACGVSLSRPRSVHTAMRALGLARCDAPRVALREAMLGPSGASVMRWINSD